MEELKEILKQIVADLEKSAAAIEVLRSGANVELSPLDLAILKNQIGALHGLRPSGKTKRS